MAEEVALGPQAEARASPPGTLGPRPLLPRAEDLSAVLPSSPPGCKVGYVYARVLEAGQLDALDGGLGYYGALCCQPPSYGHLEVAISCSNAERTVSTARPARVDPQLQKAVFGEELLLRSLSFCGADRLSIALFSKSALIAEASIPLRVALPQRLLTGPCSREEDRESQCGCQSWLPPQRLLLRAPGRPLLPAGSRQPYLDLQLLQLVDNSLPQLVSGVHPLMLAIQEEQEQLVRAFLFLDVAETMSPQEQARCLSMAVEKRNCAILTQLLDQMQPSHLHLVAALRLRSVELVEALLQAGGAMLLTPWPRAGQRAVASRRRRREVGAAPPPMPTTMRPHTPLSLACALGDEDMVEALCQWARRERVQVDPSAPPCPGGEVAGGLWDQQGEPCGFGDPPIVMVVRGKVSLATKLSLLRTLVRHGFAVDAKSAVDSWTPLLAAVETGELELVTALVRLGARLSADKHLGFTPLHLACQVKHWHLVPHLVEAMQRQHGRVAAWGPSPQYVSLNLVDAYGRTALDIALTHYFANPLPFCGGMADSSSSERQKAVDILREFVHRSPPNGPGIVCGWELLHVLRFLEALPEKKAVGAEFFDPDWGTSLVSPRGQECLPEKAKPPGKAVPYSDMEELLQAVRVLVRSGAQTQWLLRDVLQAPTRGLSDSDIEASSSRQQEGSGSLAARRACEVHAF